VEEAGQVCEDALIRLTNILENLSEFPEIEADLIFAAFDMDGDIALNRDELRQVVGFMTGNWPTARFLTHLWSSFGHKETHISKRVYIRWLHAIEPPNPNAIRHRKSNTGLRNQGLRGYFLDRPPSARMVSSRTTTKRLSPLDVLSSLQSERVEEPKRPVWFDRQTIA
jgi:hypothetical protein